jgi:hypothetical protein
MSVTYGWRPGARIAIDPQKAGETLAILSRKHNGGLGPEVVVDAARDEASPLHDHFEWSDTAAAAAHRAEQARELIRSITVETSRSNLESKPARAFINVDLGSARTYIPTVAAMSSADLRKQIIERAYRDLEAWRQRYAELTELARIFEAIDKALPRQ